MALEGKYGLGPIGLETYKFSNLNPKRGYRLWPNSKLGIKAHSHIAHFEPNFLKSQEPFT